ncbi:hypothetical protein PAXRUDRAFT_827763 [Paxillus rubicundulus Ve08.2h10]|uniref:Uncharacterized protein n=1 Tax=Paxillus rubicundulus Ve08.2h10 TaxID=930991 RepID=A0A0D0E2A7_9AGAM|nr:hypothetical protein PAXRUDRAFT_827763 [Paxillus rubicundulus Ve08.2h10]
MWHSRQVAGNHQYIVDEFRKVLFSSETRRPMDQIEDFGRTLDKYIADFSRVVKDLDRSEQIKKIHPLENKLSLAKAAMDSVIEEVPKELGWKFHGDVVVTGITFVLAIMAPMWWAKLAGIVAVLILFFNIMGAGAPHSEARKRHELVVNEYKATKNEYQLEQACLRQMANLESTLDDVRRLLHHPHTGSTKPAKLPQSRTKVGKIRSK